MEPILLPADDPSGEDEETRLVHEWRAEQLSRLGLSRTLAEMFADLVDWHAFAGLVDRGCSPDLALEIVR